MQGDSWKFSTLFIIEIKVRGQHDIRNQWIRFDSGAHADILPDTVNPWQQINLAQTKRGAVRGLYDSR